MGGLVKIYKCDAILSSTWMLTVHSRYASTRETLVRCRRPGAREYRDVICPVIFQDRETPFSLLAQSYIIDVSLPHSQYMNDSSKRSVMQCVVPGHPVGQHYCHQGLALVWINCLRYDRHMWPAVQFPWQSRQFSKGSHQRLLMPTRFPEHIMRQGTTEALLGAPLSVVTACTWARLVESPKTRSSLSWGYKSNQTRLQSTAVTGLRYCRALYLASCLR